MRFPSCLERKGMLGEKEFHAKHVFESSPLYTAPLYSFSRHCDSVITASFCGGRSCEIFKRIYLAQMQESQVVVCCAFYARSQVCEQFKRHFKG